MEQSNIVVVEGRRAQKHISKFFKQWGLAGKTAANGILQWQIQRETDGFPLNKEYYIILHLENVELYINGIRPLKLTNNFKIHFSSKLGEQRIT